MAKDSPHIELIARAVLIRNGRVLLCRNVKQGFYYLPGGHIEFGEPAAEALQRELQEECGLRIRVRECVQVSENVFHDGTKRHHELNVVFHVEQVDAAAEARSNEAEIEFDWVEIAALVDTDLRPEAARAWLVSGGQSGAGCEWVPMPPSR